jgi:type IV secretion system protein VirB9
VIIKATDSDLMTDLIIATNRRTYVIKLVSRRDDWMPFISFSYPEDQDAQWAELKAQQQKEQTANVLPGTGGMDVSHLKFDYQISGDSPDWKPLRIYTDGQKTYIQFPKSMQFGDAPALVALGPKEGVFSGPTKQLVNYRVVGDRYVVDKVLDRAALISGVGHGQVEVQIARSAGN